MPTFTPPAFSRFSDLISRKYKDPFLKQIKGATSKELLLRAEDVQVIHGFESEADAKACLSSELFQK